MGSSFMRLDPTMATAPSPAATSSSTKRILPTRRLWGLRARKILTIDRSLRSACTDWPEIKELTVVPHEGTRTREHRLGLRSYRHRGNHAPKIAQASTARAPRAGSREVSAMKPERAANIKYGVWGLIGGAVIAMIVGFAWGGWTTAGTTQTRTKEAVLASQAAICVAQFMKQPNHDEKLKELEQVSSWQRAEGIEKRGLDRMPGQ